MVKSTLKDHILADIVGSLLSLLSNENKKNKPQVIPISKS